MMYYRAWGSWWGMNSDMTLKKAYRNANRQMDRCGFRGGRAP